MAVPDLVRERLGGEKPVARVPLNGDDELWLTPTRSLIYRAEGLLSGETVDEYPLEAQRLVVTDGRKKTTIQLDRGYDGAEEFTVPSKHTDAALRYVVEGVLASAGVIEDGESVEQVFRLGELSLVVTDGRVVKHVGAALWTDDDHEEFPYGSVSDLELEQGSVSSELVIEVDGRPQRVKTPSDQAPEIRRTLEAALLEFHGVDSLAGLRQKMKPDEVEDAEPAQGGATAGGAGSDDLGSLLEFGDLDAAREELGMAREAEAPEPTAGGGAAVGDVDEVAAELASLRETVEHHGERIDRLQSTLERLIEELRRVG